MATGTFGMNIAQGYIPLAYHAVSSHLSDAARRRVAIRYGANFHLDFSRFWIEINISAAGLHSLVFDSRYQRADADIMWLGWATGS